MSRVVASVLDTARLTRELPALRASFDAAVPFRHVVIDHFLDDAAAHALRAEFPALTARQSRAAQLLAARVFNVDPAEHGAELREAFAELGAEAFTQWLRALTGVEDLEMDPLNVGGGIHRGSRGSQLYVHADHNTYPADPTRYRRFNVLVYLTPDWTKSWGGELELWDAASARVVQTIEPRFNRCVITEVHDHAFHGYRRLRFPAQETRDSIAAYYYSSSPSPLQAPDAHPTVFGAERDASLMSRTASHVRRVLLKRFFSR